ncbi:hypothetical protein CCONF_08790 [Corynebacterium confusum]|nr:hypothetical protein CCONF_08790 [Corynebacterium confusum]
MQFPESVVAELEELFAPVVQEHLLDASLLLQPR